MPNAVSLTARSDQRGGALVEFAMILPLAMIFLFGMIQFGIAMFEYHATTYAAKMGARYASVHGSDCTGSGCPTSSALLQTMIRKAVPGAGNATVSAQWSLPNPATYAGTSGATTTCSSSSQAKGCFVVVTVTNSGDINIPFVHHWKNVTFKATSTAMIPQ